MNELYSTISIFLSSGLLLALGLMLLFSATGDSPLLGNYRKARRMMAVAYLFFACINLSEYLFGEPVPDVTLLRTITLAIAVSQSFLFTFAMLALLETRFPGWPAIFREAIIVLTFIASVFVVYIFCSATCFDVAFWVFAGIYAMLLVRYTCKFTLNYHRFHSRMDNYFSDNEAGRLRWVAFSFFAALAIGIGALLTTVFMSTAVALVFTVVYDVFYLFFAIRLISYAVRFHRIKEALDTPPASETMPHKSEEPAADSVKIPSSANFDLLEQRIRQWVADMGYVETGLTINLLAPRLGTNREYLSKYINTCKGMTFRKWINGLKIEEAKALMQREPELTVSEVAHAVGFTDKSNFIRTFTSIAGMSPKAWKIGNR